MALLIDEIRRANLLSTLSASHDNDGYRQHFSEALAILTSHLPTLSVQNVADYFYANPGYSTWKPSIFPNVAPPFQHFWSEYKHPIGGEKIGSLMIYEPLESGWSLHSSIFSQGKSSPFPLGSVVSTVDSEGAISDGIQIHNWFQAPREVIIQTGMLLAPILLAISFLHCKNVQLEDNRVPKPLAKKWHEKYNLWPSPYKTLVIEPMKEVLKREGRSEETGLKRAMHICRGHFRDYRQGAGLFGKHHVLVYQPSIVRGTVEYDQEGYPPRQMEVRAPKKLEAK